MCACAEERRHTTFGREALVSRPPHAVASAARTLDGRRRRGVLVRSRAPRLNPPALRQPAESPVRPVRRAPDFCSRAQGCGLPGPCGGGAPRPRLGLGGAFTSSWRVDASDHHLPPSLAHRSRADRGGRRSRRPPLGSFPPHRRDWARPLRAGRTRSARLRLQRAARRWIAPRGSASWTASARASRSR